jgi:hypothetical protein
MCVVCVVSCVRLVGITLIVGSILMVAAVGRMIKVRLHLFAFSANAAVVH